MRGKSVRSTGRWSGPEAESFWEGVEEQVRQVDWQDVLEFVRADQLPIEPDPAFAQQLRLALRRRFVSG